MQICRTIFHTFDVKNCEEKIQKIFALTNNFNRHEEKKLKKKTFDFIFLSFQQTTEKLRENLREEKLSHMCCAPRDTYDPHKKRTSARECFFRSKIVTLVDRLNLLVSDRFDVKESKLKKF